MSQLHMIIYIIHLQGKSVLTIASFQQISSPSFKLGQNIQLILYLQLSQIQHSRYKIVNRMGKKKTPNGPEDIKSKQGKSSKPKNKEMFTELQTHQENKISKFNRITSNNALNPERMDQQNEQDSCNSSMDLENTKNNEDMEKVCAAVHHLLLKNKVSPKNAFEVPLIDLEKLQQFEKISESENGWRKIASTLENDSKIYSYRVEAIHQIAYKIVNTMNRNQDEQPTEKQMQQNKKQPTLMQQLHKNEFGGEDSISLEAKTILEAMLQKNIDNLNIQSIDKLTEFNPTYERTRRRFDQNGLKGMLLNNIQIDANIELSLNEIRKVRPTGFYKEAMPVQVDYLSEPLQICKKIENMKISVCTLTKQEFIPSTGYELNWNQIKNGRFICENGLQMNTSQMDIEIEQQRPESNQFKKVEDAIKLKMKKKKELKSSIDVAQDGLAWLSQLDRKMLGINMPIFSAGTIKKPSPAVRVERNEDDIDFDVSKELIRTDVFTEDTMQRLKNEFNEQIQEKHLLPLKLFHKFKVQQVMSLREEPPLDPILFNNYQQQMILQRQNERENEQIDLKAQQLSIRQSKQKLKQIITKEIDFNTLYRKFGSSEGYVSPQLCFLTVLHLANENNLKLEQMNQFNFKIKS